MIGARSSTLTSEEADSSEVWLVHFLKAVPTVGLVSVNLPAFA
jgi:hypothetical protein